MRLYLIFYELGTYNEDFNSIRYEYGAFVGF